MFCNLTRWLISRAEDRGKKAPRFAERHAERCGACAEYESFAASLSARLSAETPGFLAGAPDFAVDLAGSAGQDAWRGARAPSPRPILLRPFPAAAAALVVVVSALVLFRVVLREPALSLAEKRAAIASLKSVTAAPDELQGIVAAGESTLARERLILEKSILSAVEFLEARLNISIERKNTPKSL